VENLGLCRCEAENLGGEKRNENEKKEKQEKSRSDSSENLTLSRNRTSEGFWVMFLISPHLVLEPICQWGVMGVAQASGPFKSQE